MKFVSTRAQSQPVFFSQAVEQGLADDGGLFVPEKFPSLDISSFNSKMEIHEIAEKLLKPFLAGDELETKLSEICKKAFNFSVALKYLKNESAVLELFHGPSAAFKDFGARFLAQCFENQVLKSHRCVLVATSGDTGGAVAAAFFQKRNTDVKILFPKGAVSKRQEKQLTCWGDNISSFAVKGSFDDCQRLVKEAFNDKVFKAKEKLTSANSINIGRLLPQMVYYAASSVWYFEKKKAKPNFAIPTGNLGNAVAAFWAKKLGFPIDQIAMSTNANKTLPLYYETGEYKPSKSVNTLANAMDVGDPSNMERLRHYYPDLKKLKEISLSSAVSDENIKKTISEGPKTWGEIWCPHTATAVNLREKQNTPHWIIVSTAHPSKFETIVEPLVGTKVDIPPYFKKLLDRPSQFTEIEPNLEAIKKTFV